MPKFDDLTLIKGIGKTRQQWLRKSLNVYTFRDLATLSVDDLEAGLRSEGQITSRIEVARWIAQAQEHLAAQTSSREKEIAGGQSAMEIIPSNATAEWKPLATFIVEFQASAPQNQVEEYRTFVHHIEADNDKTWSGIESARLSRWIQEQLRYIRPFKPPEERPIQVPSPAPRPGEKPSLRLVLEKLHVFQPPEAKEPLGIALAGQTFSGPVEGNRPFDLEAVLKLEVLNGEDIEHKQLSYQAKFYASNLLTGSRTHLGDTAPGLMAKDRPTYLARLKQVTLDQGLYRVQVLVTLEGALASPGVLEVKLFRVG